MIQRHQLAELILMAKHEYGTYHKGSFLGDINDDISLILCEDNISVPSNIQSYVLHCYHKYLFHTIMDRTEAIISQHLYWTVIINSIWGEVTHCDTCQCTKLSNKKYGTLSAKLSD